MPRGPVRRILPRERRPDVCPDRRAVRHATYPREQCRSRTGRARGRRAAQSPLRAYMTTPMARQSIGIWTSLSDEDWLKWWDVNVHGVFYCMREALKLMEPQKYGKIINIASIAAISAGSAHSPGYSASKA